jgi:hypothetical protein
MKRILDVAAVALTSLLLFGFVVLALRGFLGPQPSSARFGMPVADPAGVLFYRVYLSRNLVIAAAGAVFLLRRYWTPLAILVTAALALPLFDMAVLAGEFGGAAPFTFHIASLLLLGVAAALLWRKAGRAAELGSSS